jgi:hypothetical protein
MRAEKGPNSLLNIEAHLRGAGWSEMIKSNKSNKGRKLMLLAVATQLSYFASQAYN